MSSDTGLQQEWNTLQNNIERYEHSALWLKLAAIVLTLNAGSLLPWLVPALLLLLWLQEGVFRTSQARLDRKSTRLNSSH